MRQPSWRSPVSDLASPVHAPPVLPRLDGCVQKHDVCGPHALVAGRPPGSSLAASPIPRRRCHCHHQHFDLLEPRQMHPKRSREGEGRRTWKMNVPRFLRRSPWPASGACATPCRPCASVCGLCTRSARGFHALPCNRVVSSGILLTSRAFPSPWTRGEWTCDV